MRAPVAVGLAALTLVGCGPLDQCARSRSLDASAQPDAQATAAVNAMTSLLDSEHDDNDQFIWFIDFSPVDATDSLVTSSHLHEVGTDEILFTFPVAVERADPNVAVWIVSAFETSTYRGTRRFADFFALVQGGRTYVDVHTAAHPDGARARLAVTQFTDWTEFCD